MLSQMQTVALLQSAARACSSRNARSLRARAAPSMQASAASEEDVEALRAVAIRAAEAGGAVVRTALDTPRNVQYKGELDLVTDTDKGSEAAVLAVLASACPTHALLGEEGGVSGAQCWRWRSTAHAALLQATPPRRTCGASTRSTVRRCCYRPSSSYV